MDKHITITKRIKEIESFNEFLDNGYIFEQCCFQNIDFTRTNIRWKSLDLHECIFLGCSFNNDDLPHLQKSGSLIFPEVKGLPYEVYREKLYTWQELYKPGKSNNDITCDLEIYKHFFRHRYENNILEALCQRIHDHSIDDGLYDLLGSRKDGSYHKKAVAVMGGHGTLRNDLYYKKVARITYHLAKMGYLIVSGGGPGIMEATNLGAYMSAYEKNDLEKVLVALDSTLKFNDEGYLEGARAVLDEYSDGNENLAIPTWFYGHEPSNLFATHIAKYFSNSIREDTLLAIALHGIIFAPGSAGTNQEIFMDLAQNHYATFGYYSPMVFLGTEHYMKKYSIYPIVQNFAKGKVYEKLLYITDDDQSVSSFIKENKPIIKSK